MPSGVQSLAESASASTDFLFLVFGPHGQDASATTQQLSCAHHLVHDFHERISYLVYVIDPRVLCIM